MSAPRPVDPELLADWKRRELAKAGPLTQEQQSELRRILLPAPVLAAPPARARSA